MLCVDIGEQRRSSVCLHWVDCTDSRIYVEDGTNNRIFVVTGLRRDTRMKCVQCVYCSPAAPQIMNHGFGLSVCECAFALENVCYSMCV